MDERVDRLLAQIDAIDEIFLSDGDTEQVTEQSCDCDGIAVESGGNYVFFTHHPAGEDGYIEIGSAPPLDGTQYPYRVILGAERFRFDKAITHQDGTVDGIRFRADDRFLFIFADEYNLVLTVSKYDLFEETETEIPEKEVVLKIVKRQGGAGRNDD